MAQTGTSACKTACAEQGSRKDRHSGANLWGSGLGLLFDLPFGPMLFYVYSGVGNRRDRGQSGTGHL